MGAVTGFSATLTAPPPLPYPFQALCVKGKDKGLSWGGGGGNEERVLVRRTAHLIECQLVDCRIEEALADYNEAIRLSPWSPNPVLNRGIAYEALGRYADAAEQYKAVIAVDETDPAGWNNLGNSVGAAHVAQKCLCPWWLVIGRRHCQLILHK
eukprot:1158422-Pelagomonas_calceolata.AAC.5